MRPSQGGKMVPVPLFPIFSLFPNVPLSLKINWALCSSVTLIGMLFSPCTPTPGRASVMDPPPQITQTLNRHENSIPKHIRFHFQNRLCVSYNVVTVPIIKIDPGVFSLYLGNMTQSPELGIFHIVLYKLGKN